MTVRTRIRRTLYLSATHFTHLIVTLDERVHDLDSQKIVIDWRLGIGKEDIWRNDSC